MGRLVASCVWDATPELIVTLDERFGESTDAYVHGSLVWLRDGGGRGWSNSTSTGSPRMAAKTWDDQYWAPASGWGRRSSENHPTSAHSRGCGRSSPPRTRQRKINEYRGTRVKPRRRPSSTAMMRTGSTSIPVSSCTSLTTTSDAE